jgi:hypothetical protein
LLSSCPNYEKQRPGNDQTAEQIQDAYLGHAKKQAAALVPAELVAGMSLIGTEGFVRDRIAAYRDAGVTILNMQVGPNALADVEKVAGWLNQRKCAG